MLALGVAPALGQLVALGAVDEAVVGEEQQPAVRRGDEEVVDDVVLAQRGPADALAAAVLGAVGVGAGALGVAGSGLIGKTTSKGRFDLFQVLFHSLIIKF